MIWYEYVKRLKGSSEMRTLEVSYILKTIDYLVLYSMSGTLLITRQARHVC